MYKYVLSFADGKLSKINHFNFRDGEWKEFQESVMQFDYNNNCVNKLKSQQIYKYEEENGHITKFQEILQLRCRQA